ncbi:MAG: YceD family protein, partial [Nitrosospira sp.]
MPARLVIDVFDFARTAAAHHGKIKLSELKRLQDCLVGNSGELNYTIRGALDREGKPILRIVIQGSINLRCQRCLGELMHALDVQRDLVLARDEHELSRLDEDESADGVLGTPDMDIMALIEDEIILSLPISPRHG